jgi:Leucine-rich repeat (LRR) protein
MGKGRIPKELTQLINLSELHIAKNNFTGSIPGCLSSLSKLQVLDLSHNKLTGSIPEEVNNDIVLDQPPHTYTPPQNNQCPFFFSFFFFFSFS